MSGRRVGRALQSAGQDVRALDAEPGLEGPDDESVLALATREERVLVTTTSPIFRGFCGNGRQTAALTPDGVSQRWLELRSQQAEWQNFPAVVDRVFAD